MRSDGSDSMEPTAVETLINTRLATLQSEFEQKVKDIRTEAEHQQQLMLQKLSTERQLNEALIKQLRESMIGTFTEWISSIKKDISENTFAIGEHNEKIKNVEAAKSMNVDHELSFDFIRPKPAELSFIEARIESLETQIDNIEDQSRRNNLKFYGIPDTGAWESWEQSEEHIRGILSEKMKIPNVENISITRAHRLSAASTRGSSSRSKNDPRPIIVKFDVFKDRQNILMASKVLKDDPVSISEDFCARTNKYRSEILKPKMDAERARGKYAVMRHRRLIVKDRLPKDNGTDNSDIIEPIMQTENITKDVSQDTQAH